MFRELLNHFAKYTIFKSSTWFDANKNLKFRTRLFNWMNFNLFRSVLVMQTGTFHPIDRSWIQFFFYVLSFPEWHSVQLCAEQHVIIECVSVLLTFFRCVTYFVWSFGVEDTYSLQISVKFFLNFRINSVKFTFNCYYRLK